MKPHDQHIADVEQDRLDRLVDDELSEAERRQLLVQLDKQPDGWRRCALAFLEAQCWTAEARAACRAAMVRSPAEPAAAPAIASTRRRTAGHLVSLAALAASFLVAFALGLQWRGALPDGAPTAPQPGQFAGVQSAPEKQPSAAMPEADLPRLPGDRWQMVTLNVPEGPEGQPRCVRLPAVEQDKLDERWLESLPMGVPPEVREMLERTGYRIRQQRQLLPVPMKDGRRLVVPVDQVDVHYVGNPAY